MLYSPHRVRRITLVSYIYEQNNWPMFQWDNARLAPLLAAAHRQSGRLLAQMETLGFKLTNEAVLRTLTLDVVKNSEIENEILDPNQVRSSIARRLGMDVAGLVPVNRNVDGVVEMMLDATQHCDQPLNKQRLFGWHQSLFPTEYSGLRRIVVANWRNDEKGPMQVVSGPIGRERVHFEAPAADQVDKEMAAFFAWFNTSQIIDPLIKAAMAHLWFVTVHPFEDGNGRIARTITDMQLARADSSTQRFYSLSAQIQKERANYYDILEATQKGGLDITVWLEWFLQCLSRALTVTESTLADVMRRARFWESHSAVSFNPRQRLLLSKLLDGFEGKLTTTKWAKIAKCSQDTALRDIQDLMMQGILVKEEAGGRSTSYLLCDKPSALIVK